MANRCRMCWIWICCIKVLVFCSWSLVSWIIQQLDRWIVSIAVKTHMWLKTNMLECSVNLLKRFHCVFSRLLFYSEYRCLDLQIGTPYHASLLGMDIFIYSSVTSQRVSAEIIISINKRNCSPVHSGMSSWSLSGILTSDDCKATTAR